MAEETTMAAQGATTEQSQTAPGGTDSKPSDAVGDQPTTNIAPETKDNKSDEAGANHPKEAEDATGGDSEMTGAPRAGEGAAAATVNGAPAGEKKAEKPKRKSTGVPEHKTRKSLSKKKSQVNLNLDAQPGQLFLARMKGHPPWPSIIADDELLPEQIAKIRPVTAPLPDGTWKRADYAPGGKRHNERTFAVMFLYTNEFAWLPNGDLQPITPDECKTVSEKSKSKSLIEAYKEAAEGHGIGHYKGLLNDHADALAEEEAAIAEREAEKARKAEKKAKRKSEAATAADDAMDVDDDSAETKSKSKKRKKEAGTDDDEKTPKTTKLKLSTPKTPATGEKSVKKKEAAPKSTKKKTPAKAAVTSDDDSENLAGSEKTMTPEEKHAKREQEVKYCRHKLQRGLLHRDSVPSDDEVKTMSTYLKKLEDYPELDPSIIRATKIHKVLKAMIKLQSIPKDEEYSFKKRSHDLLAKWNKILADHPAPSDEKGDEKEGSEKKEDEKTEKKAEPTTNGDAKEDKLSEKADEAAGKAEASKASATAEGDAGADKPAEAEEPTEPQGDAPDVDKAPAEEYKPPVESVEPTAA